MFTGRQSSVHLRHSKQKYVKKKNFRMKGGGPDVVVRSTHRENSHTHIICVSMYVFMVPVLEG